MTRRPRSSPSTPAARRSTWLCSARTARVLGAARVTNTDHDGTGGEQHLLRMLERRRRGLRRRGTRSRANSPSPTSASSASPAPTCPRTTGGSADGSRRRHVTPEDVVRNDTFAVLRAGTERPWGVGVVCGYGTNCCGVAPDGRTYPVPRDRRDLGRLGRWDATSARAALWNAMRAEDGRGRADRAGGARARALRVRAPPPAPRGDLLRPDRRGRARPAAAGGLRRRDRGRPGRAAHRRPPGRRGRGAWREPTIRRLRLDKLDVDVVLGGGIFRNERRGVLRRASREGVRDGRPGGAAPRAARARPSWAPRCSALDAARSSPRRAGRGRAPP